jgi:hypothetical protein
MGYAFFCGLRDNLINGYPSTAMQIIRKITSHYLMNSELTDISDFTNNVNTVLNLLEYIITKYDDLKDTFLSLEIFNKNNDDNATDELEDEMQSEPQLEAPEEEIPVDEISKTTEKKYINVAENTTKSKKTIKNNNDNKKTTINNKKGDDMKEMDDVIKLISENFEFDEKITEQNLKNVLTFIIKDYANKLIELDNVKFEKVLTEKKMQLKNVGLEDEIIQEAFSNLKSIEEIEKETNRLLKLANSIAESKKTQVIPRKGKMDVSNNVIESDDSMSMFERMLNII